MDELTIDILDTTTNKQWTERYNSYYFFRRRIIKLRHSKKLKILSCSYSATC